MRRWKRAAGFALLVPTACLGGCLSNAIAFTTATQLAVDISTTEQQPGIRVGYRRLEGVTMPTRLRSGEWVEKAYPVVAAYRMETGGLWPPADLGLIEVRQVFASGRAAVEPTSTRAVMGAFDPALAPLVDMPSGGATDLGASLYRLLDQSRNASPDRRAAFYRSLEAGLGLRPGSVTDADAADDAIQQAADAEKLDEMAEAERGGRAALGR